MLVCVCPASVQSWPPGHFIIQVYYTCIMLLLREDTALKDLCCKEKGSEKQKMHGLWVLGQGEREKKKRERETERQTCDTLIINDLQLLFFLCHYCNNSANCNLEFQVAQLVEH